MIRTYIHVPLFNIKEKIHRFKLLNLSLFPVSQYKVFLGKEIKTAYKWPRPRQSSFGVLYSGGLGGQPCPQAHVMSLTFESS